MLGRLRDAVGSGMPAIRDMSVAPRAWVAGIDDISAYLEQRHPVPPLGTLAGGPSAVYAPCHHACLLAI